VNGTVTGTVNNPGSLTIPVAGIYIFSFGLTYGSISTTTWANASISGAGVPASQSFPFSLVNSSNSIGVCGSLVINATASVYLLNFGGNGSSYSLSAGYLYFNATRIA